MKEVKKWLELNGYTWDTSNIYVEKEHLTVFFDVIGKPFIFNNKTNKTGQFNNLNQLKKWLEKYGNI
jgi:hypothetical protein